MFQMFDSGFGQKDLIFSDDTESLQLIPWENQTYKAWLGPRFIQLIENLEVTGNMYHSGLYNQANRILFKQILIYYSIFTCLIYLILY